ncbi:hypothetical protein LXA43DRAFT_1163284, partial [Ganoderma leucocontextum]
LPALARTATHDRRHHVTTLPQTIPNICITTPHTRSQMSSLNSTDLFSGNACFSPRVPAAVQKEWVHYGGNVATLQSHKPCPTYIFCDGEEDPWFARLFQRSMAIFHWTWISAVVAARFRLPISTYVLDGQAFLRSPSPTTYAYVLIAGSDIDREDHAGDPKFRLLLSSSSGAISVSDALEALQHVSTEKAALFTPGTTHLGKEFRCWYA